MWHVCHFTTALQFCQRVFKALYHLHDVILIIKVILFDASLNNLVIAIAFSFQCIKHRHLG